MMEKLFLTVLNMSVTAAYVTVFVLAARLLLRRAPKAYSYMLWSVVFFRLVCPVSFSSGVSLLGGITQKAADASAQMTYIPQDIGYMAAPAVSTGAPGLDAAINGALPAATPAVSANPMQLWIAIGTAVWLAGLAALLLYAALSYLRLCRRVSAATPLRDNIYLTEAYSVPFVSGIFSPRIYLPAGAELGGAEHIIRHEQVHILRRDYLLKPLAFLITAVHWFDPLAWTAYLLLGRDMEMSCDERVLRELGGGIRADYSRSLLAVATRQFGMGIPLAFGESNTKARVKNVMKYKKPALWVLLAAAALSLVTLLACAANPKSEPAFDAQVARDWGSSFSTTETDRASIGKLGYGHYMEAFMGEDVPEQYRILSYEVTGAEHYTDAGDEFSVRITSSYTCCSTYWLSANGEFVPQEDGTYICTDNQQFLCIRALGGDKYEIYDIGTGGNLPGAPVSLRERAQSDFADLAAQSGASRLAEGFLSTRNIAQARGWREFGQYNAGELLYSETSDSISVLWRVITGMSYTPSLDGQLSGPELSYKLERATGRITEKDYTAEPESYDAELGLTYVKLYEVDEAFYNIDDARLTEIAEAMYQLMQETDITPPNSSTPAMHIELMDENSLYFANADFVPELSLYNEGRAAYDPAAKRITVRSTIVTGTSTGVPEGPVAEFVVNLAGSGSLVSRSYEPEPSNPEFRRAREYDGSFQTAADARLVELGKMFYSIILNKGEVVTFTSEIPPNTTRGNTLHFYQIENVPEFGADNDGTAAYNPDSNRLTVQVKITTLVSGDEGIGPKCSFTVDLTGAGRLISRSYEPEPQDASARRVAVYDGSLASATDARLVEIARGLYASMFPPAAAPEAQPAATAFIWPLPEGVGEYEGSLDAYEGHTGVDILAPRGTEVFAAAGGTVMEAEPDPIWPYGRQVYIKHAAGYYTRYAHLDSVAVKVGEEVEQGQRIGRVGNSGNATTYHLHFEVRFEGDEILDPLDFIS